MSKIYFTLTGINHYFGKEFLKKGTKIRLEKELDNEYDKEAIKVTYEGLGKIGYVANSSYTVLGEMMGLIGAGNNPMVGMTVAVAVAVQEAADAGKF